MTKHLVILGDVHAHVAAAKLALEKIEAHLAAPIDLVLSVGDFGLFPEPEDWLMLTGPSKYRRPDWSPAIRTAWEEWRWPTLLIGGNHEPFHLLRGQTEPLWGGKLHYRDAGEFPSVLPGLRVLGLSGIWAAGRVAEMPTGLSWADAVREAEAHRLTRKALTYYRDEDLDALMACPPRPHILLLHGWPTAPARLAGVRWDERIVSLVEFLKPRWIFCGHHHHPHRWPCQGAEVVALNIISHQETQHGSVNPGWAALADWDGTEVSNVRYWPELR